MNPIETQTSELLGFFKALADPSRLKIVGLLAREELAVEQIAAMLDLRPSTVSSHLSYLAHAGLVSARAQSYYNVYRLEIGVLQDMARRLLSSENLQAEAAEVDMDAYDQKVIKNYTGPDGRIKQFPSQFKKMKAILRYVVQVFETGKTYTEREVNALLSRYNDDTATLRRELVEQGLMAREGGGGKYWRVEEQPAE
jgi:DNA-binding MarR family transcriptional regulator